MNSPYAEQLVSPTQNDYLRLKSKSSYYFEVGQSTPGCGTAISELLEKGHFHLVDNPSNFGLYLGMVPAEFNRAVTRVLERVKVYEQEKGLHILYLTFGTVAWELGDSEGIAPLLRLPCQMAKIGSYWDVRTAEADELTVNPLLSYLLGMQPTLDLPEGDVPWAALIQSALRQVTEQVNKAMPGWKVETNRYHFGAFVYTGIPLTEVDPAQYTNPEALAYLVDLQHHAGEQADVLGALPSDEVMASADFEKNIPHTLLPADSSQLCALMDVAAGANLVLQGPPGTGKSQTIANLIFDAVSRGKTVLFVAQKETALDVVYQRFTRAEHAHLCLRLYPGKSTGSERQQIYEDLERHDLWRPADSSKVDTAAYAKTRDSLMTYGQLLTTACPGVPLPPYEMMGQIVADRAHCPAPALEFPIRHDLSSAEYRLLLQRFEAYGEIRRHIERLDLWEWYDTRKISANEQHARLGNCLLRLEEAKQYWEPLVTFNAVGEINAQICDRINKTLAFDAVVSSIRKEFGLELGPENVTAYERSIATMLSLPWWKRLLNPQWRSWKKALGPELHIRLKRLHQLLQQAGEVIHGVMSQEQLQVESRKMSFLDAITKVERELENLGIHRKDITGVCAQISYLLAGWNTSVWMEKLRATLSSMREIIPELPETPSEALHTLDFPRKVLHTLYAHWEQALEAHISYTPQAEHREFRTSQATVTGSQPIAPYQISPQEVGKQQAIPVAEKRGFALIRHIMKTPKARVTVRQFVARTQESLLKLKPCWMTTPSRLAQYVPRDAAMFDLVVIDEASQMLTGEAMGSLFRAKQYVIVGDTQQMPPSLLMREVIDKESEEEPRQSVLQWAAAVTPRERTLLYHYRSEHHSLIAFSNHHFYRDRLYCVPGQSLQKGQGVVVLGLNDKSETPVATYSKGGTNLVEAKELIREVQEYIVRNPGRSIGIVSMNQAQQEILKDLFEEARATDVTIQNFCRRHEADGAPVFIKNLETVQGDERDTIFISTVYGPDAEDGKVHQSFGINSDAREDYKRINVLITRARKQVIVVTSLRPQDITSSARGPQLLKDYLIYGRTGDLGHAGPLAAVVTGAEADSPWEEWFLQRLRRDGYTVDPQVGCGRWRIDLAVRGKGEAVFPEYICGIELDGAAYHSSVWARERDALRQDVLESKGWTILRVWSRDFFRNTEGEYQHLVLQIEKCIEKASRRDGPAGLSLP